MSAQWAAQLRWGFAVVMVLLAASRLEAEGSPHKRQRGTIGALPVKPSSADVAAVHEADQALAKYITRVHLSRLLLEQLLQL